MLMTKDSGTTLDTLPNHRQQFEILTLKEKTFLDDQTKTNILNNYFISVRTDEPELLHSLPTLNTNVKCTLRNLEILPTELTKRKPDKVSGPDLLNVNVLRNCLEVVEEQKDLGMTICDNLKPSTHIKYIRPTNKANQRRTN